MLHLTNSFFKNNNQFDFAALRGGYSCYNKEEILLSFTTVGTHE